jgi:DNA-binding winged helix-turn-helix (wHTH) protein
LTQVVLKRSIRPASQSFPIRADFLPIPGVWLVRFRFRDCVLDTGIRVLTRNGDAVGLSPKAFRLLEVLASERPNAVSHDDLRARLWPGTITGGTTLARLVSEARAAIGDRDDDDRAIRTVHRFGYAFAAAVADDAAAVAVTHCAIRWGSQLVPLAPGENVIGRAPDVLITVPSSKVSRRHARIVVSDSRVVLEDLASRNGTYLGGRRIDAAIDLKNGDRIGIGSAQLVFCSASDDAMTSADSVKASTIARPVDRGGRSGKLKPR